MLQEALLAVLYLSRCILIEYIFLIKQCTLQVKSTIFHNYSILVLTIYFAINISKKLRSAINKNVCVIQKIQDGD